MKQFKIIALSAGMILALTMILSVRPGALAYASAADDAATTYKAKCAMCHGAKAEKTFDATKPDEQLIESVLKGVKPKMPAFETKGIDAEQAKALVAYMKSLKQ